MAFFNDSNGFSKPLQVTENVVAKGILVFAPQTILYVIH